MDLNLVFCINSSLLLIIFSNLVLLVFQYRIKTIVQGSLREADYFYGRKPLYILD